VIPLGSWRWNKVALAARLSRWSRCGRGFHIAVWAVRFNGKVDSVGFEVANGLGMILKDFWFPSGPGS
jgi:hypothetical protein